MYFGNEIDFSIHHLHLHISYLYHYVFTLMDNRLGCWQMHFWMMYLPWQGAHGFSPWASLHPGKHPWLFCNCVLCQLKINFVLFFITWSSVKMRIMFGRSLDTAKHERINNTNQNILSKAKVRIMSTQLIRLFWNIVFFTWNTYIVIEFILMYLYFLIECLR